jgi:HSP20 family protein
MNLRSLIPIGRSRDIARREYTPFWSLQREIDRLFDDFTRGFPSFSTAAARGQELLPAIDVVETDKEIELTAELPGLEEKDVQINLADNVLTIRGEKKSERDEKNKDYMSWSAATARSTEPWSCLLVSTTTRSRPPSTRACSRS